MAHLTLAGSQPAQIAWQQDEPPPKTGGIRVNEAGLSCSMRLYGTTTIDLDSDYDEKKKRLKDFRFQNIFVSFISPMVIQPMGGDSFTNLR